MDRIENQTGIFFSVWVDAESLGRNRAKYNIHALKLRMLRGYSITSRDFASDFRQSFAAYSSGWPNVSVQHGPLTLMQGCSAIGQDGETDLLALLNRFEPLGALIDRLLEARRK